MYQSRPKGIVLGDDEYLSITADTAIVENMEPIDTGLIAPDGRTIYRVRETVKIGYHKHD